MSSNNVKSLSKLYCRLRVICTKIIIMPPKHRHVKKRSFATPGSSSNVPVHFCLSRLSRLKIYIAP